jgi:hypothetical protein
MPAGPPTLDDHYLAARAGRTDSIASCPSDPGVAGQVGPETTLGRGKPLPYRIAVHVRRFPASAR